jgi:hypothetical protein
MEFQLHLVCKLDEPNPDDTTINLQKTGQVREETLDAFEVLLLNRSRRVDDEDDIRRNTASWMEQRLV